LIITPSPSSQENSGGVGGFVSAGNGRAQIARFDAVTFRSDPAQLSIDRVQLPPDGAYVGNRSLKMAGAEQHGEPAGGTKHVGQ
jgi:hypothetical protein